MINLLQSLTAAFIGARCVVEFVDTANSLALQLPAYASSVQR
jgi:hypothetical protein